MARAVLESGPLGFPWATIDPFLFCVHHDDAYPAGNARMGPAASLAGRDLGQDFAGKDGWRMYHGADVPGFPAHPHRGFETVTIVRRGLVDHSDSLGAAARYGQGDVQWLTAGGGVVHAEMFPLVDPNAPNPLELFQIWLNLPPEDKLAPPHFTMFWADAIPRLRFGDDGRATDVSVIAGAVGGRTPLAPPPRSYASRPDADVAIWTIRMDAGARWTLPPAAHGETVRVLYLFAGPDAALDGEALRPRPVTVVEATEPRTLSAGAAPGELLVLQGRPIGAPVAQHGPFVMNTRAEVEQAFADYRRTRFGGWPWPSEAPVHPREEGRFARHADGRLERATDVTAR